MSVTDPQLCWEKNRQTVAWLMDSDLLLEWERQSGLKQISGFAASFSDALLLLYYGYKEVLDVLPKFDQKRVGLRQDLDLILEKESTAYRTKVSFLDAYVALDCLFNRGLNRDLLTEICPLHFRSFEKEEQFRTSLEGDAKPIPIVVDGMAVNAIYRYFLRDFNFIRKYYEMMVGDDPSKEDAKFSRTLFKTLYLLFQQSNGVKGGSKGVIGAQYARMREMLMIARVVNSEHLIENSRWVLLAALQKDCGGKELTGFDMVYGFRPDGV
jgi:hypothetical protein